MSSNQTGILAMIFWSLAMFISLYLNYQQAFQSAEDQAAIVARSNLNKDKAIRQWVSNQGGFYARVGGNIQPSPYLTHIPKRDVDTSAGNMTLINPAYMQRLMADEYKSLYGISGRIVGLKALRPENLADSWEKKAIKKFEANRDLEEYFEISSINSESYLRMMTPLYMKKDCEKCHAVLGYKEGDLRGGVNISVPLKDFYTLAWHDIDQLILTHGGIWLLGIIGIGVVTVRNSEAAGLREQNIQELKETEKALAESEDLLHKAQEISRIGHWEINPATWEISGSAELYRIFGLSKSSVNIDIFVKVIHPDDREFALATLEQGIEYGEGWDFEHRLICPDGIEKWVHSIGKANLDQSGKVVQFVGTLQDITKLKVTSVALTESELWMKSIYNSLDEAVLVVSPDREIINVNNAAIEIFGYSAEEIVSSSTELFHVDHEHYLEFGERINRAFKIGHAAKFEFKAKRKNGEIFPTEHTVSLLKDPDGKVKGIVSVVRDITDRKLSEQTLLKSEARLNEAQRIAKVGVWELDLLTNELVWSDEIYRIFEIDRNKFSASYEGFLNAIHPEDREMVDNAYTKSLADKKPYEITHRLLMKNGRIKYVHEKCESFFDDNGKAIRSVGTIHDITERIETTAELARVQEMLEQSNKIAVMGAWDFDLVKNELVWNEITKEIHEVEADYEPVLEEAINFYKEGIHRDTVNRKVREAMKNGGSWNIELIIVTAKGNEKWVRAMGQSELKDGQCIRLYGSFQDITEHKLTEIELEKYRHHLEEVVLERTRELQKSLSEKEVLLKEVHHRVKNNMAMVSAFLHLQMSRENEDSSLDGLKACESRIRAMSMVHKRLYQSSDFANIDMEVLIKEISDALFKESGSENIELDIQVGEIFLEMDTAIPCAMIINELLSNALKYAFEEGQAGKVSIHMTTIDNDQYHIRVTDNGAGLPEEVNIENPDTLGMQLIKVFVGQLDGKVDIYNENGTVTEISFPAETKH